MLYKKLAGMSNVGFAGDYKGFDKRHRSIFMKRFVYEVNKWYNDDH